MDILLIPGLWLDGAAWADVVPALEAPGHRPAPLPVPAGVTKGVVRLADERRYDVPVVLVCPEELPGDALVVRERLKAPGNFPPPRRLTPG